MKKPTLKLKNPVTAEKLYNKIIVFLSKNQSDSDLLKFIALTDHIDFSKETAFVSMIDIATEYVKLEII